MTVGETRQVAQHGQRHSFQNCSPEVVKALLKRSLQHSVGRYDGGKESTGLADTVRTLGEGVEWVVSRY